MTALATAFMWSKGYSTPY